MNAPFVKVEATKFTEIGYVGRDVESMVRDLVETSIRMVKAEKTEQLKDKAEKLANERIVSILVPSGQSQQHRAQSVGDAVRPANAGYGGAGRACRAGCRLPDRAEVRAKLLNGELEEKQIEIEVEDNAPSMFDMFAGQGKDQMGFNMQELFGNLLPKRTKKRRLPIKEARKVLINEEAQKLIEMDEVIQESIRRAEQSGIIFIDEIDKIASTNQTHRPGRIAGRRAAGYPADRGRFDGDDEIWSGEDGLYLVHRCRGFSYCQAVRSDP